MIYSQNQIKKAGQALLGDDEFAKLDAIKLINSWRASFSEPMSTIEESVAGRFEGIGLKSVHASRIKRMPSIIGKLKAKSEMGLGTLQDIGGVRFVFDTLDETYKAFDILKQYEIEGFERVKEYDYIGGDKAPKESGYRGIHIVYKSISDDQNKDGYRIEVQLRDKLQHYWAMAVETASLVANTTLKANLNDAGEWRNFFKLISAIFAIKEGTKVHPDYIKLTHKELCEEYGRFRNKLRLVEQLKALRASVVHSKLLPDAVNVICVLILDYNTKNLQIRYFSNDNFDDAKDIFNRAESESSNDPSKQVLMASLEGIKELPIAYPSYFLDTKAFFEELDEFERSCNVYK